MSEKEKQKQTHLCVDDLRHSEYYQMQTVFDDLYAKSQNNEVFNNLMDLILSRKNILLAYRNIKSNTGSRTAGTDKQTIKDIAQLTPDEVVEKVCFIVQGSKHGYRPKPVRRKDIPKAYNPNETRPLGIPCIWDRLIQQCIKQVLEPICEAKFSDNSYGFRPNRSVEHAMAKCYFHQHRTKLHYVVEFDIKGFFDNVNHSKLIKQIWALGIHDKHLIYIIKKILKAPIKMPDGTMLSPDKGTPQGGIISPLLANIVLNELDQWVDSQWRHNPVLNNYKTMYCKNGEGFNPSGIRGMKKTNLKEMYIVRYADDFRIFCRTKSDAEKIKIAVTQWLAERLKLEVSQEKTKVVNLKRRYAEFLGFKFKVCSKSGKPAVRSHVSDKAAAKIYKNLQKQIRNVQRPRLNKTEAEEVRLYNLIVLGVHNYYNIATHINKDCAKIAYKVNRNWKNRLKSQRGTRLVKEGRELKKPEKEKYGKSGQLRYVKGSGEPIYPIGYIQCKNPMNKRVGMCSYTSEGRANIHNNICINNKHLMWAMMNEPLYDRSVEYADNRISLFSAQCGKCAVTGRNFVSLNEIHCHHKIPEHLGGTDSYENLILVLDIVHKLIHATNESKISSYLKITDLTETQLTKLNKLREEAGLKIISA